MVTAILLAAGKSERMGAGTDKAFLNIGSKPVIAWSLLAFERCPDIDSIVLVVRKEQKMAAQSLARMFGISKLSRIVAGGTRRQDSAAAGLEAADIDTRIAVVHDGARPCVTPEAISETVAAARRCGAAVLGRRMIDTVKYAARGTTVTRTEDRSRLWTVQTPQAFNANLLRRAYKALAADRKAEATDDAQAVEMLGEDGVQIKIVESNAPNFKITTADDLQLAAAVLKV